MPDVINPILFGFEWTQAFDLPSGTMQVGDTVRAEFRKSESDTAAITEIFSGSGMSIVGDRITMSLTEEQARLMKPKAVKTSIVIVRGSHEIAIGQIITIPVVVLPTRSLP